MPVASPVRAAVVAVLSLLAAVSLSTPARAGDFTVASCQGDTLGFTTTAFTDFATRGMNIKRACNPEGPGVRGLVTANTLSATAVPRGSVAMVALSAPAGTTFTQLNWAGTIRRTDCRYALQLYAEVPNRPAVSIKNVRANRGCSTAGRAQARGYRSDSYNVSGATRIVQRVICMGGGGRRSCSGRKLNYLRTYKAVIGVADQQPPTATVLADTPIATGAWVNGLQPLNYSAEDNVGIRLATVAAHEASVSPDQRNCALATSDGAYANPTPCPNGPGQIQITTRRLPEGTQQFAVAAQDTAGNVGTSEPITARIDNTAPSRVDVAVEDGEAWRNTNGFAATWTNPPEPDRAPIAGATYKLCAADGSRCSQSDVAGEGLSSIPVQAPGPGEWTVSLWRRDAAGNVDSAAASVPVRLRYDPEPPQLSFDTPAATDPTLLTVPVIEKVSGLASGEIEISPAGAEAWQALNTDIDGTRLAARVDDAVLPPGPYSVRAVARDNAGNETVSTVRSDGQPMALTLPIRIVSAASAGVVQVRTQKRTVKKNGRRRVITEKITEVKPAGSLQFGEQSQVVGKLTNRDGQGIPGLTLQVLETSILGPERLVGEVATDANGAFSYAVTGTMTRTLRFVFGGSPVVLPASTEVGLTTAAQSTLRVSRTRLLNGQSVTFSGHVPTAPIPPGGKLVQVEVRLKAGWQTFRTVRTDAAGNWSVPYRFARTRGIAWYRFRVALPAESGYPFTPGVSKSVRVRVRGR